MISSLVNSYKIVHILLYLHSSIKLCTK